MSNTLSSQSEFKRFTKELNEGERVEGELLKTFLYSVLSSIAIIGILYIEIFRHMEDFIPKYGFYVFFVVLSYAVIIPSIRQVRAYKQFACMSGMMIGMTSGMIAGFLSGFFVGATNGMFWGSVFGMGVGIVLDLNLIDQSGRCVGKQRMYFVKANLHHPALERWQVLR